MPDKNTQQASIKTPGTRRLKVLNDDSCTLTDERGNRLVCVVANSLDSARADGWLRVARGKRAPPTVRTEYGSYETIRDARSVRLYALVLLEYYLW